MYTSRNIKAARRTALLGFMLSATVLAGCGTVVVIPPLGNGTAPAPAPGANPLPAPITAAQSPVTSSVTSALPGAAAAVPPVTFTLLGLPSTGGQVAPPAPVASTPPPPVLGPSSGTTNPVAPSTLPSPPVVTGTPPPPPPPAMAELIRVRIAELEQSAARTANLVREIRLEKDNAEINVVMTRRDLAEAWFFQRSDIQKRLDAQLRTYADFAKRELEWTRDLNDIRAELAKLKSL